MQFEPTDDKSVSGVRGAAVPVHLITPEYPPAPGGVAAHSQTLAEALLERGFDVVVWSPADAAGGGGGTVHVRRELGSFGPASFLRVGRHILARGGRILLQWVPHGFGLRSCNLPFCLWVWHLSRKGIPVHLLVHELFLPMEGSWKQRAAGLVHRLMIGVLVRAATSVRVASGGGCRLLRPYLSDAAPQPLLAPSFSSIGLHADGERTNQIRADLLDAPATESRLIGHFSTFNPMIQETLANCMARLHCDSPQLRFLLIGHGGGEFLDGLRKSQPALVEQCVSTGFLCAEDISLHIQACDLMLQPCPDGVNVRHTSVNAALLHGLPVATFRSWHTEPFWKDGQGVLLERRERADKLCARILAMLDSPEELASMGLAAQEFYHRHCSAAHVLDHLAESLWS